MKLAWPTFKTLARGLLAGALTIGVGTSATAVPASISEDTRRSTSTQSAITDALHDLIEAGVPGVTASVRRDGQVWQLSAGEADLATGRKAKPDDLVRIGSVTKTYVATILLQLEGERRLSLDDTVAEWLPGLIHGHGNDGTAMTIRMLLNHSSGLPDYVKDVFPAYWETTNRNPHFAPADLVKVAMQHPPTYPPGSDTTYSNTGYVVAGLVIEAVTGHSLAHEIQTRIARPLGLRHTSFPTSSAVIPGHHLEGYLSNHYYPFENVTNLGPAWAYAAGAVISTPADVATFHHALFAGQLLEPEQLEELTTVVSSTSYPGLKNGLGFAPTEFCGHEVWTKDGEYPGYLTQSFTSRDAERQIVYSINSDSYALEHEDVQQIEKRLQTAALC